MCSQRRDPDTTQTTLFTNNVTHRFVRNLTEFGGFYKFFLIIFGMITAARNIVDIDMTAILGIAQIIDPRKPKANGCLGMHSQFTAKMERFPLPRVPDVWPCGQCLARELIIQFKCRQSSVHNGPVNSPSRNRNTTEVYTLVNQCYFSKYLPFIDGLRIETGAWNFHLDRFPKGNYKLQSDRFPDIHHH